MSFPDQNNQDDSFDAERTQPRQLEWRPPEHRPDRSQVTQQARPAGQGGLYDRRYRRPPTEGAPTWLVFLVVGLLMAIIIALGAAFILSRKSREPASEPTAVLTFVPTRTTAGASATPPATAPPEGATEEPTSPVTQEPTGGATTPVAPPTQITVGGYVEVVAPAGLSLRQSANTTGALIEVMDTGTVLQVVEGPQQSGDYTWWKLRKADGTEGWSAGGSGEDVFLEATTAP